MLGSKSTTHGSHVMSGYGSHPLDRLDHPDGEALFRLIAPCRIERDERKTEIDLLLEACEGLEAVGEPTVVEPVENLRRVLQSVDRVEDGPLRLEILETRGLPRALDASPLGVRERLADLRDAIRHGVDRLLKEDLQSELEPQPDEQQPAESEEGDLVAEARFHRFAPFLSRSRHAAQRRPLMKVAFIVRNSSMPAVASVLIRTCASGKRYIRE